MDIRDEIDRSFGSGPQPEPVTTLVTEGRRALRRRRLAIASTAAAVAVAVGGTTALATAGGGHPEGAPLAGRPSQRPGTVHESPAEPKADQAPPTRKEIEKVLRMSIAEYDGNGHLEIDPRAEVVQRIDNPFGLHAPRTSVGLALGFRGGEYWYALYEDADGSGGGATVSASQADKSFEDWVASQRGIAKRSTSTTVGPDVWPGVANLDLVSFVGDTEELEPSQGVTILEQRAHVSVGSSFAGPGDHTAVALVEAADGKRYYVLARSFDGKPGQYIAVPAADGGATLDDFLDLARQQYAEGGGGLL